MFISVMPCDIIMSFAHDRIWTTSGSRSLNRGYVYGFQQELFTITGGSLTLFRIRYSNYA